MDQHEIPQTLDDPPLALIFNAHQFISFFIGVIVGVVFNHPFLLGFVGLVLGRFFTRYADSRADGFLRHMLYFHGLPVLTGRRLPHGLDRVFRP